MLRAVAAALIAISISSAAFAQDELKAADAELNRLYRQIQTRLSGDTDTMHLLTVSQRAWIAFRDAECAFAASTAQGGSAYPEVVAACRTGLTQSRVKEFQAYLNCEEGDLACPVPAK